MQVPLEVLKSRGEEIAAALSEPWMYFWITGGLSSVLDNAPTYLVFFKLAETGMALLDSDAEGGVGTPGSFLGEALVTRLQERAELTFAVEQ